MSEKAGNNFWDLNHFQYNKLSLVKFPSRITERNRFGMEFVAELPKEYQGTGLKAPSMLAHRDDKTGKEYIMFIKCDAMPIRWNIEKNRFEKMESTDDGRWEWRKY